LTGSPSADVVILTTLAETSQNVRYLVAVTDKADMLQTSRNRTRLDLQSGQRRRGRGFKHHPHTRVAAARAALSAFKSRQRDHPTSACTVTPVAQRTDTSIVSGRAAFTQDAIDNKAFAARGKLTMPVLALGGDHSFGTQMADIMRPSGHCCDRRRYLCIGPLGD
jgi:hypothetical protein